MFEVCVLGGFQVFGCTALCIKHICVTQVFKKAESWSVGSFKQKIVIA